MRIRISDDVLFQEVSGETVLLDLASAQYFGLDEVGTRVWQLLNEGLTEAAIIGRMLQEFEVEQAELERDVAELLGKLETSGLIQRD